MIEVVDAIERHVTLDRPPTRVVSLVPSETASVAELAGVERLVGRTDYCVEPAGIVTTVQSVGGTKRFDVEAVKALRPDLVLANQEENSRRLVQALMAAGLTVHVSFPCTVRSSLEYVEALCVLLGIDPEANERVAACRAAIRKAERVEHVAPLPVFVPIWKDPWMTFDGGTYANDVLRICGARNVFAERSRLYPLAADLGNAASSSDERAARRDTRYPRIRLEEVIERGARAVLLPDEPYPFSPGDARELSKLQTKQPLLIEPVDGKDLFWYGTRVATSLDRLGERIGALRKLCFRSEADE